MLSALALMQVATVSPPVITPAPDPWPTHVQACGLMQQEARGIARRAPRPEAGPRVIEQVVDCEGRTVTRVIAVDSKKIRLAPSAQQTADKFACSSPRNQTMYERDGWAFRAEFRGPGGSHAIATAQITCPPSYPFNDEPHERGMSAPPS